MNNSVALRLQFFGCRNDYDYWLLNNSLALRLEFFGCWNDYDFWWMNNSVAMRLENFCLLQLVSFSVAPIILQPYKNLGFLQMHVIPHLTLCCATVIITLMGGKRLYCNA